MLRVAARSSLENCLSWKAADQQTCDMYQCFAGAASLPLSVCGVLAAAHSAGADHRPFMAAVPGRAPDLQHLHNSTVLSSLPEPILFPFRRTDPFLLSLSLIILGQPSLCAHTPADAQAVQKVRHGFVHIITGS